MISQTVSPSSAPRRAEPDSPPGFSSSWRVDLQANAFHGVDEFLGLPVWYLNDVFHIVSFWRRFRAALLSPRFFVFTPRVSEGEGYASRPECQGVVEVEESGEILWGVAWVV